MLVLNQLDRFHLAIAVIDRLPELGSDGSRVRQCFRDQLIAHAAYIRAYGEDMPEIRDWRWPHEASAAGVP
jgi:xylulose-5-phosphate/fructose-6-phosphate phosphoketolase